MWPYWIVFIFPSIVTIFENRISARNKIIIWYIFLFFLIIFIGLRYEVGGDWDQYNVVYKEIIGEGFNIFNLDIKNDYFYTLVTHLSSLIIEDNIFVNFILSIIFIISLNYFIEKNSDYFLVLTGAIPIHITVVGMGFVRQAIAISFFLIAIKYLTINKNIKSFISIIIGIGFHKTLFPMLTILLFIKKTKFLLLFIIIFFTFISYLFFNSYLRLIYYYSGEGLDLISYGALYRITISILFSVFLIVFSNILIENSIEKKIYFYLSFLCILSFLFVFNYSTLVDRFCFYFIPIQLFVLMRLKKLFKSQFNYFVVKLCIIIFYASVYFVWLNFSYYKFNWLPYKNIFFL